MKPLIPITKIQFQLTRLMNVNTGNSASVNQTTLNELDENKFKAEFHSEHKEVKVLFSIGNRLTMEFSANMDGEELSVRIDGKVINVESIDEFNYYIEAEITSSSPENGIQRIQKCSSDRQQQALNILKKIKGYDNGDD